MPDHETASSDGIAQDGHQDHPAGHGGVHPSAELGPVDIAAWSYALAGSLLGLFTVLALYVARGA
jgi:hypothetical protein